MKLRIIILIIIALLLVATLVFISCSETERLTDDIYFSNIDAQNIKLGGAPLLIPAYAEIYQTAFETVECVVADTYYIVQGPTTSGEILGFVNNGFGRLTYTDITPDRVCLITTAMAISVPLADRPAIISAEIFLNGVADVASYIGEYISDEDPADALPIMCLMELQPNDYIEIYVASDTDDTTVVINTMTLVATTVD